MYTSDIRQVAREAQNLAEEAMALADALVDMGFYEDDPWRPRSDDLEIAGTFYFSTPDEDGLRGWPYTLRVWRHAELPNPAQKLADIAGNYDGGGEYEGRIVDPENIFSNSGIKVLVRPIPVPTV